MCFVTYRVEEKPNMSKLQVSQGGSREGGQASKTSKKLFKPLIRRSEDRDAPLKRDVNETGWRFANARCQRPFAACLILAGTCIFTIGAVNALAIDSSSGHKVQVTDATVARQLVAEGGRLVADYGSFQLYDVPSVSTEVLARPGAQSRDEYNFITLKAGHLDTRQPEVQALRKSIGTFTGKHLHL